MMKLIILETCPSSFERVLVVGFINSLHFTMVCLQLCPHNFLFPGGSKRPLLPNAPSQSFIVCPPGAEPCFLAGDKRCNEQTALTIMHTLWLREHNRVAQHLKNKNPSLTSDEVFQLAQKIVVSELQKIT